MAFDDKPRIKIPTQKEVQAAHEKEHFPKKRQDALAKLREQSEKIMTPKVPAPTEPISKTPRLDALVLKVEDQADQIMRLAMKVELLEQRLATKEANHET